MIEPPFSEDAIADVSSEAFLSGEDHSPYAQSLDAGQPRRMEMVRWVIRAREQRISHLGLMLPSRASRRFSRINLLWMSIAVAVAVFANAGWHVAVMGPGVSPQSFQPTGRGWFRVTEFETDPARLLHDVQPASLWWNQPWATIAGAIVFVATWVMLAAMLALVGLGGEHVGGGGRCRCAVHYATAWMLLMIPAVLLLVLRPLSFVAMKLGFAARASTVFIDMLAILLGVAIAMLWLFWLVRLSAAAPANRRNRVRRFFAITTPIVVVIMLGSAIYGARYALPAVQKSLHMQW